MIAGFTGTREGMTEAQMKTVTQLLQQKCAHGLHHGDCVGADTEAHKITLSLGLYVVIHPPKDSTLRAWCKGAKVTHPPKSHIARNHNIVDASDFLIATPKEENGETLRSGTWATVRYARKKMLCIFIVRPNGTIDGANLD